MIILILSVNLLLLSETQEREKQTFSIEDLSQKEKVEFLNKLAEKCFFTSPDKTLEYSFDALKISEEIKFVYGKSIALMNIGSGYYYLNQYDKALDYYQMAVEINQQLGNRENEARSLNRIGLVYKDTGDNKKALTYFSGALEIQNEIGDKRDIANTTMNIALIYLELNEFKQTESYLEKSLKLAEEIQSKELIQANYLAYSDLYTAQSMDAKALEYFKHYSNLKYNIISGESNEKITEIQNLYDAEKRDRANKLNRIKTERMLHKASVLRMWLIIILFVELAFMLFYVYSIKRKDNRKLQVQIYATQKAEKELRKSHEELKELHLNLEKKVDIAIKDIRQKDHIIIKQFRTASMGQMITNIAHHWRQPLMAVGAIIQNFEDIYEDGSLTLDYIQENTDKVMDILQGMSRTIDDFRIFFRPHEAEEKFYLKEAMEKVLRFIEVGFKENKIKLEVDFSHDNLVPGLAGEFSQVIMNILDNAKCVFIERKIKSPKVKVSLIKKEDKNVIVINDNGGGIPPNVMDRIFDPYFSTRKPGMETGMETGLGLYMAKIIIEKNMKGKIFVKNTKEGAEFIIEV